jgi:phosphoesterase RecJ-like protein
MPLQINQSILSVFLREDTERNVIRVSLRSVDDFPCNSMAAEFFNGGGHLNAAGGELSCPMDEAEQIVKNAMKKYSALLKKK